MSEHATLYEIDFVAWADETANNARDEIETLIEDSPSLRSDPAEILDRAYAKAREKAVDGAGLGLGADADGLLGLDVERQVK